MILIYTTCKTRNEAETIAVSILQKRLAVCVNYFSTNSSYIWEEKIKSSKEFVCFIKTKKENFLSVTREIKKINSYKTPCILKFDVSGDKKYMQWLNGELK